MAKKKIESVEAVAALPSDSIVTEVATTTSLQFDDGQSGTIVPSSWYVSATTIPPKPVVDINKVLSEMIALMGTVESFEGQGRVLRAVAAFYNLTDEFGG